MDGVMEGNRWRGWSLKPCMIAPPETVTETN